MTCGVRDHGTAIDFTFGEPSSQYAELTFDTSALREFLALATRGLAEAEASDAAPEVNPTIETGEPADDVQPDVTT